MKYLLSATILLLALAAQGQENLLQLDYGTAGLGSNRHRTFFPTISLNGLKLTYSVSNKIKGTSTAYVRRTSVDSIINIVKQLRDTAIFRSNTCIRSGAYHYLNIVFGHTRYRFTLVNTFDADVKSITDILNSYLPNGSQIKVDPVWKAAEQKCLDQLINLAESDRSS